MSAFRAYSASPDEFAKFTVGDVEFVVVTAPESGLRENAEVIPTMDEKRVLIALSEEKVREALPDDMPDMARGVSTGMLLSACVALAERWLAGRGDV
jgi:hypothetical protein